VQIPVPPDGFSAERLDSAVHDRDGFACGVEALDDFLRTKACQAQDKGDSATRVLVEAGKAEIIGFVTLATLDLPTVNLPERGRKITNRASIQVMVLARMGVDVRYQKRGLGDFLVKYALRRGFELWDTVGCHAMIVDAKNDGLKAFYSKYGFAALPDHPLRLYLPIGTLTKLLPSLTS
jgi:GNAT superfamily N-acetyltransferase